MDITKVLIRPLSTEKSIKLMEADENKLSLRSAYNIAGISFTPKELAAEIKKRMPEFSISYKPDFRQAIADSWPASIDDSIAREDWGHDEKYDLGKLVDTMLKKVAEKLKG
jgi:nucleoside-diphosphate-sugar epimerase